MRLVLFCEGHTEAKAMPLFLKRWLDGRLQKSTKISPVRFQGCHNLLSDIVNKARRYLLDDDVIAVISLLDLYGIPYPAHLDSVNKRYCWIKKDIENKVGNPRLRQFFAVHELEAWLLSDPNIFPREVREALQAIDKPETINFDQPPAQLLQQLYKKHCNREYKKVTNGLELFLKLDPGLVYKKCPYFAQMMDEILDLAKLAYDS